MRTDATNCPKLQIRSPAKAPPRSQTGRSEFLSITRSGQTPDIVSKPNGPPSPSGHHPFSSVTSTTRNYCVNTSGPHCRLQKENEPSRIYRSRLEWPWAKREPKLPKRSSRLFFSRHLRALFASLRKSDSDRLLSAFYSPSAFLSGL